MFYIGAVTTQDTTQARRYALDELASLAGVTPRTVRYYIAQGLLERPAGEKRGAHYLARHLEQLLQVRRWSEAGLSLERIRELLAGSPEDPPPRPVRAGSVEVWSRITLADGLEVHIEPSRAGLDPQQLRDFVREATRLYRQLRASAQAHQDEDDVARGPQPGEEEA